MSRLKVAVIVGSNRRQSINRMLAEALVRLLGDRVEPHFIRIDDLPMYNADFEADRPGVVNRFTAQVAATDALLVVTPEYNHSTSGVLKNAIDFLYAEWNNKAMGVVSYGAVGGTRAAEHLRLIAGELQMADVRTNVALSAFTDFENFTELAPGPHQAQALDTLFDQATGRQHQYWNPALGAKSLQNLEAVQTR